ncbi:MAG: FkbM family methyltransferase, partial [Vulcanisaeta sp.]
STSGFIDIPLDLDLGAIMAMYFGPMMRSTYSGSNVKTRLITLKELINETNVNTDVLKMNCEGCEYDVILNDYDHLRLFREVVFEYHRWMTGISVSELLKILGRDYNCNFIGIPYEDYGYVHCIRKDIV